MSLREREREREREIERERERERETWRTSVFVDDDICGVHSRLSAIITVNSMGGSGACACRVAYFGRCIFLSVDVGI